MKLTDIFKFKLFERTDKADLDVVNENFQSVETIIDEHKKSGDHDERYYKKNDETMIMDEVVEKIYPIGSIYISANNANPGTIFGGTWEQIKDTFLLSAGSNYKAGATGGEATHKLTTAEMPSHSHSFSGQTGSESANHTHYFGANTAESGYNHTHEGYTSYDGDHSHIAKYTANDTASGSNRNRFNAGGSNWSDAALTNSAGSHRHYFSTGTASSNHYHYVDGNTEGKSSEHIHYFSGTTGTTGSESAHNNMPPYLVVYMWKRTA